MIIYNMSTMGINFANRRSSKPRNHFKNCHHICHLASFPLMLAWAQIMVYTAQFIAQLFHPSVPLEVWGEYQLVLAICYCPIYWPILKFPLLTMQVVIHPPTQCSPQRPVWRQLHYWTNRNNSKLQQLEVGKRVVTQTFFFPWNTDKKQ